MSDETERERNFKPFGFQSGSVDSLASLSQSQPQVHDQNELTSDDSYAGAMHYDPQHNLVFFTGSTYGKVFDSATNLSSEIKVEMGMSGDNPVDNPHLDTSDCFLGILKLPTMSNEGPKLIYARRFGTPDNVETCSSLIMLPPLQSTEISHLKLGLLGHVIPKPLNSAEVQALGDVNSVSFSTNRGGFLQSLSTNAPVTELGHAYGFIADFDVTLTQTEKYAQSIASDTSFAYAYGALVGGLVLESSPLVYPTTMTQNKRDPNQIYVVSMHHDDADEIFNPDYTDYAGIEHVEDIMRARVDVTMGGAGLGTGTKLVKGGSPMFGNNFYAKVQQLTLTPADELVNVAATADDQMKRTMESGWKFGFNLNDADDIRPSSIVFVKGRTPDNDLLLLGGTTRKDGSNGKSEEWDGFITKIIPPAPSPVADLTSGSSVADALQDETAHPTKRIDSTTDRDETVTAICLPPPDPESGIVTHAYVVGSTASNNRGSESSDPSLAYIIKVRISDLSTVWKQHVPSVHPSGIGGVILGEGCVVSPDGSRVYLSGTIDGGSALDTRILSNNASAEIKPVGGLSDVFVIAYGVEFGHVHWAKQLGTVNDDTLARGGGIACDNEGNVIIMGNSRGGLQRYRQDETSNVATSSHLASDIFVMSLSHTDGEYINAPFKGSASSSSSAPATESAAQTTSGGGISPGAIAGVSLLGICISGALLYLLMPRCRRKSRRKYKSSGRDGDVLRSWERNDDDDYSFGSSYPPKSASTLLSIVRGGVDDWDDGSEGVSRNATWMSSSSSRRRGVDNDDDSVYSAKSSSSKRSYTSKQQEENFDFIGKLREEANATMRNMIKQSAADSANAANDPRLDGGASIKSLLSQYREVKKNTLIVTDDHKQSDTSNLGVEGDDSSGRTTEKGRRPPPPPPPRNTKINNEQSAASSANGLSEFTIV
ncbi:hypothetical protein ACHAWU_000558 [Discostella pseudostelligera]|uniref:Uncharacterized protein n=1 Tax=Discostella pseudostelligera TaxID=259834 RepID=A0ABD3M785_9STRA